MAKVAAKLATVGIALATSLVTAPGARADQSIVGTVVVHLDSQVSLPIDVLRVAQQESVVVYRTIGLRLVWTGGHARSAETDDAQHLDVVMLRDERADAHNPDRHALGVASRDSGRAYVFYGRLADHARDTNSDIALVLALVLAHEVGHLLLPEHGHAPAGLMSGNFDGHIAKVPGFSPAQAAAIRKMFSSVNRPLESR